MEFYRYEAHEYAVLDNDDVNSSSLLFSNPKLNLYIYNLHKETPKGYWIGYGHPDNGFFQGDSTWVSKTAKKRYAYPTKEEALVNFVKRTELRVKILSSQIDFCKKALKYAEVFKKQKNEKEI